MNSGLIIFLVVSIFIILTFLSFGIWYYNSLDETNLDVTPQTSSNVSSTSITKKLGTFNIQEVSTSSIKIVLDQGTSSGMSPKDRISVKLLPENSGQIKNYPEKWSDLNNYVLRGVFDKNLTYTLTIETLDTNPKLSMRQTFTVV